MVPLYAPGPGLVSSHIQYPKAAFIPPSSRGYSAYNSPITCTCTHSKSSFDIDGECGMKFRKREADTYTITIGGTSCCTSQAAIEATFAGRWFLRGNTIASLASAIWGYRADVEPFRLVRIGEAVVFYGSTCRSTLRPSIEDLNSTLAGRIYLMQLRNMTFKRHIWS